MTPNERAVAAMKHTPLTPAVETAISNAVADERERCAHIAETMYAQLFAHTGEHRAGEAIAAAIRKGT